MTIEGKKNIVLEVPFLSDLKDIDLEKISDEIIEKIRNIKASDTSEDRKRYKEKYPYHHAFKFFETDTIKEFINNISKLDINRKDNLNDNFLHVIFKNLSKYPFEISNSIIELLIKNGISINHRNIYDETPLYYATFNYHLNDYEILLKNNADINIPDYRYSYPITKIISKNCISSLEKVIKHYKPKLNIRDKYETPLITSILDSDSECTELLLKLNAIVDFNNERSEPPIQFALRNNKKDHLDLLIKYGSSREMYFLESKSEYKKSKLGVLGYACIYSNIECIKVLLKNGYAINNEDNSYIQPISACVMENKSNVLKFLINNNANIHLKNVREGTALDIAKKLNFKECIDILEKQIKIENDKSEKAANQLLNNEPNKSKKKSKKKKSKLSPKSVIEDDYDDLIFEDNNELIIEVNKEVILEIPKIDRKISFDSPPKSLCCPITFELMFDPVLLTADNQTYDRTSIEEWLKKEKSSPLTGKSFNTYQLIPNYCVKQAIEEWVTMKR